MSSIQFKVVPNHPSAQYAAGKDVYGRFWIWFTCTACGDRSQKLCSNPQRTNYWVVRYSALHLHR